MPRHKFANGAVEHCAWCNTCNRIVSDPKWGELPDVRPDLRSHMRANPAHDAHIVTREWSVGAAGRGT